MSSVGESPSRVGVISSYLTHEYALQLYRVLIGVLFIASSIPKIMDFDNTVLSITAYDIFPYTFSTVLAYLLITAELTIAVSMLAGVKIAWGAALNCFLMIVFIFGIGQAWMRGISLDCGCFGVSTPADVPELTPWTDYALIIVRDIGLLTMGVLLVKHSGKMRWLALR